MTFEDYKNMFRDGYVFSYNLNDAALFFTQKYNAEILQNNISLLETKQLKNSDVILKMRFQVNEENRLSWIQDDYYYLEYVYRNDEVDFEIIGFVLDLEYLAYAFMFTHDYPICDNDKYVSAELEIIDFFGDGKK